MRKNLFTLAFVLSLICTALAQTQQQPDSTKTATQSPTPKTEALKAIPDEVFKHKLKGLDGQSIFLSNYRGRVFVLTVWASWCGPCLMQISELNKLYEDYSKRGVEFVGLSTESPIDVAKVRASVKKLKVKYKIGWIDGETAYTLLKAEPSIPQTHVVAADSAKGEASVTLTEPSIPQTYVVAADGRVVFHDIGYNPNKSSQWLRDSIEKALKPAPTQ